MPYSPGIEFRGDQYTAATGQNVTQAFTQAFQRYEEERRKKNFNEGVFDILKGRTDSEGNPYFPVEAIQRWHSLNPDKQAGYLSAAGARMKEDADLAIQQSRQQQQEALELSEAELAAAEAAGVVPLRQSNGSFQYAPKAGAGGATGGAPGTAVYDDAGNQIGVWDAKGKITKLNRPAATDPMKQKMADMMGGPGPAATPAPAPTPAPAAAAAAPVKVATPAEAQALPTGTRYTTPDGRTFIR